MPRNSSPSAAGRRDRISGLSDDVLGHVLSCLPNKEAARTAVLSSRWRHIFGSVQTISFEQKEGDDYDNYTYFLEAEEQKSLNHALLDSLSAALMCRRRCAGPLGAPLRSFRFAFDRWNSWDKVAVDEWLAYVLPRRRCDSNPGLHLDLCFRLGPVCALHSNEDVGSDSDDDARDSKCRYLLPRRLFACTALRTLCVTYCRLKLPRVSAIDLPFLETMHLKALGDSGRSIQRLISSCPRLADLTLEALWSLKRVSVFNKRLRRFSISCCHNLKTADIDGSELRLLEYRGRGPPKSFLCLHGSPTTIDSSTVDLCKALSGETEFARFTGFLEVISNVKHLHLHHGNLESSFFDAGFPVFSSLTRLTLQGCIRSSSTIVAVSRILRHTPNLEAISLLMWKPESRVVVLDKVKVKPIFSLPCLREITLQDYEGSEAENMLVKHLLLSALVLERLKVVFTEGRLSSVQRNRLEVQIGRWGVSNSEKIFI